MSKLNNLTDFLTSLADKFRAKLGTAETINPQDFDTKVDEVYEKAVSDEYDLFWDTYQGRGSRRDYSFAFSLNYWNDDIFHPKYGGSVTNATQMFYYASKLPYTDLTQSMGNAEKPFSFTDCTNYYNWITYSAITKVPKIDLTKAPTSARYIFNNARALETVTELAFSNTSLVSSGTALTNAFTRCDSLKNITITGTICNTGLDLHWSTLLTTESLLSILTALSKDSAVAAGLSITLPTAAQEKINASSACTEQYNAALSAGWTIAFA